ncbi:MAG: type IV toxin-antitoxin system AbiEi family antitoxin domain-containing protein [Blastococcus sp.]
MHPQLRAVAERRDGVITAADALRAGYGHPEIRQLLTSGRWIRLRRGVYIPAADLARAQESGRGHRVACLALLLALDRPTAAISHDSAARLWVLPTPRGRDDVLRLTDPTRWRRGPDYVMSRAPLRQGDVWRTGPLRLTSAARTLVDCAREWPLEDAVVAMDAALLAERTTIEELHSGTASVRNWPGAARAARAVDLADGRAESPLETRGRLRIVGSGFSTPELQVEIRTCGRLVGVVDAWFDGAAVAVEFDGRVKYTDPWRERSPERVLWEEKRREDELRALDIRVLRIADADLGSRWPGTEGRLQELLRHPGPTDRRFTAVPRAHGLRRTG